jgi:hypothetical protein
MRMLTDKIDNERVITTRGQSGRHWPFLECALAKLEETHGARIHNGDDDRLVALAKSHERVDLDWCWSRRGR